MTITCDERVMLELGAQAVWQFPTFSRKEVQLVVHMSRSLSDELLRVDRSAVILDFQHVTAFLHSNVCSQLAHDRDWCQRRNELFVFHLSTWAPRARGIASLRSRPRFQQGNPELARPWLSRFHHTSRSCLSVSHPLAQGRADWEVDRTIVEQLMIPPQVAVLQCPSSHELVPGSNRWTQGVSDRSCIPQQSWTHHQTTCKMTNYASSVSWGGVLNCSPPHFVNWDVRKPNSQERFGLQPLYGCIGVAQVVHSTVIDVSHVKWCQSWHVWAGLSLDPTFRTPHRSQVLLFTIACPQFPVWPASFLNHNAGQSLADKLNVETVWLVLTDGPTSVVTLAVVDALPHTEHERHPKFCRVFYMDSIPVGGEIVCLDKDTALRSRPTQQTENARVVAWPSVSEVCNAAQLSSSRRSERSQVLTLQRWAGSRRLPQSNIPSARGMPPVRRLAKSLLFGRSARPSSLFMKAEVRSPRAISQWRPAAMNKKVQIEDVCGVGEDRSSWRISGSRWPRTHHRHEFFDAAPTPAQGFSRKTCLKGTTLWSKCFRVSRAAAAEMLVAAEVPRMAVHSATVARRKRDHSESGIRCRGSSSFRVILVAVKPVNFGRLRLNCAVMLSWVLPKSSLHSSWKRQAGCPKFSQMWSSTCKCHNTSGPPQSTCPPQLQEPWRESSAPDSSAFGPSDCAGRAFQPRTLRWRLVQRVVPVPGCSVVSRRRAPQGRALAPFAPDGSMGGGAWAHADVALAPPSPVTLHPVVETGFGLVILVRSLLSLLG